MDNIIATEKPDACVVQFGGQTAIKLAKHMDEIGLPILGTPADAIDEAEDRERFDELLERCNIPRAPGRTVFNLEEALAAADEIGLPVLMRPSYVLGGQNMIVAYTKADVIEYMGVITEHVDMDHPVLLDKYIMGTECEVDAICDGENYLIPGIMEQVERTGVHSGDSICVYPAQHLTQAEIDTMVDYTGRFARELHVTGLVNVQYAVSNGKVYVIEVNPRSSRTVPYISKVTGVPMVDLAVRCCLGEKLTDMGYGTGLHPNAPYVAVKVPVFSFEKLHGVDTQFGPEMKSTGEVLGIAPNYHDALLKGLIGAGYTFKTPGPASCCIFTVKDSDKPEFVDIAWKLKSMGYKLYGTSGTCAWLNKHMVPCNEVRNMSGEAPNIVDLLQSGLVDYVFSTSAKGRDPKRDSVRLRRKAVELSIPCITAVDTANALVNCLRSEHSMKDIPLVDIATLYHKNKHASLLRAQKYTVCAQPLVMRGCICYTQQRKICQKTLLLDVPGGYRYMTRSQMIETVARKTGFTEAQVETTMDALFDQIADCLRADEKVTIAGFGRFEMRPRKPKAYTNPKTKVSSRLESTSIPGFKASGRFKQKLEAGRAAKSVEETA